MRTLRSRISSDIEFSQASRFVFLYAASAHAAAQAEQAVRNLLDEHDVEADIRCDRWNPISKSWTSHENLMNAERRKSAGTGRAAWQVRVGPSSHRELKTLARRLEADGFSVTQGWRYLFTGANCEDDTHALADRIRGCSSADMPVRAQRVYDRPPPVHVAGQPGQWVTGGGWYEADGEWHPV